MKIFLDTGDVDDIRKYISTGLIDGVTTNPSIIAKTGRPFKETIKEICDICSNLPVSAEVMADDTDGMIKEARDIAGIASNVVIKLPCTIAGLSAIPILEQEGIPINLTMVFSSTQAYMAMKVGASYVSIVLSRLDANGIDSTTLVDETMKIKVNYAYKSEIIAGSMKTQNHVIACLKAGVDIITVPPLLLEQMSQHILTTGGIDAFKKDWKKVTV